MGPSTENLIRQVDLLTAQLNESSARFDSLINEQRQTVAELNVQTRKVVSRNRLLVGLVALVLAGLVGIGTAVAIAIDASHDVQRLVARQEEDRLASSLSTCRIRNASERATRIGRLGDIEAISESLRGLGVDEASITALESDRRAAIPDATVTERDCDDSGHLDEGDYPANGD